MCLAASAGGAGAVSVAACDATDALQLWSFLPASAPCGRCLRNVGAKTACVAGPAGKGCCLSVDSGSPAAGAKASLYGCGCGGPAGPCPAPPIENMQFSANFSAVRAESDGFCLSTQTSSNSRNTTDLKIAEETYRRRRFHGDTSEWQDIMQAALLGNATEAKQLAITRLDRGGGPEGGPGSPQMKFPGFYGVMSDANWVPDEGHASILKLSLGYMLLFDRGPKIIMFAAWPKEWDAQFKLHAEQQTVVEVSCIQGELTRLVVTPAARRRDLVFAQDYCRPTARTALKTDDRDAVLLTCKTCAEFCGGDKPTCSFPGPASKVSPTSFDVTRYTPADVLGLDDKDSADAAGDMYFGLEELITPMHCRTNPNYFKCANGTGRFLYYDDVYIRYRVQFDGVFGPYSACNPRGYDHWTCDGMVSGPGLYISAANGGTGPPDPDRCACPRSLKAVGWVPKGVNHRPCKLGDKGCGFKPPSPAPWPAAGFELQSLVGGNWYSTRHEGRCNGTARPSDGSGCTWRIDDSIKPVAKNVSCVHDRVLTAVLAKNKSAFALCVDGNQTLPEDPSDCWTKTVFSTILQSWNGQSGKKGMQAAELVGPFEKAMGPVSSGGCPDVKLRTTDAASASAFYADAPEKRIMPVLPFPFPASHLTLESCSAACSSKGYAVCGVEAGHACFCGHAVPKGARPVPASQCCNPCSGNTTETCGGIDRILVFSTAGPVPAVAAACNGMYSAVDPRNIYNGTLMLRTGYLDQPYCVVLNATSSSPERWLCTITGSTGGEGSSSEHISSLFSPDQGHSWSKPLALEPPALATTIANAYSTMVAAPGMGAGGVDRVYCIYGMNLENITHSPASAGGAQLSRTDCQGEFVSRFSDDGGESWSKHRTVLPIPLTFIDLHNEWSNKAHTNTSLKMFWTVDQAKARNGVVSFAYTKIGKVCHRRLYVPCVCWCGVLLLTRFVSGFLGRRRRCSS